MQVNKLHTFESHKFILNTFFYLLIKKIVALMIKNKYKSLQLERTVKPEWRLQLEGRENYMQGGYPISKRQR